MTFLHKLAKRLALVYPAGALLSLLSASCGQGRTQEFLGPDPHKPGNSSYIGLSIAPRDVEISRGDSVRFEARGWLSSGESVLAQVTWGATGGTISSNGWFRSDGLGSFQVFAAATSNAGLRDSTHVLVSPSAGIMRLDITPATAAPPAGTQQQFTAIALMGDGSTRLPTVTWSATGGTITSTGLFTAAATPGDFSVTASLGDGAVVGRVEGNVADPVLVQLALEPLAVSLDQGDSYLFMARAVWSDGSTGLPSLLWTGTGGTTSPDGLYTAGAEAGAFRVAVTSQSQQGDTASVYIRPRIIRVRVAPASALLALGASLTMKAYALRSDGIEGPVGVQWTAQGGSIQTNGTYTAGTVPGLYRVIGTVHALGGQVFADTAEIQVGSIPATLQQLVLTPPSASLQVGQTVQFTLAATWIDGSSATPAVTWAATGGTVTAGGAYTAGTTPGVYRVIAAQQGGGKADTSAVTVTAAPTATVRTFTVSPHRDTVQAGHSRQYSAALTWSDGLSHPASISWLSGGGTITQSGAYTAGSLAGSFLVIATCSCGAADTAAVVVASSATPPTLSSLSLTPPTATLAPGATQQFVVSGSWSDGASSAPAVLYIATGGTMSPSGLYAAGPTPGSYGVIAVQVGGTRADTSIITIQAAPPAPTLTQLVLNPSAVTVASGATQQFVVSASWSDGSSMVPPVGYTATGGTVTAGGLYTAGSTTGAYRVIVTQQGGTKADTSAITISPPAPAPTLTQLVLNPSSVSLVTGGSQLFAVSGSWSDGSSTLPSVTYTATGGTITSGGLYTAGAATGTYRVIATHVGGTLADSGVVTLMAPPPTITIAAELPRAYVNTAYAAPTGQHINVPAGGNLQAALNAASCGDEILLAPGATYAGSFALPAKNCAANKIHIRTAGTLPPEGVRVTPAVAASFAKIVSPNGDAPIWAHNGARGYRLIALEVYATPAEYIGSVYIGGDGRDPFVASEIPGYVTLDRMYIHGLPHQKSRRCVALNGIHLAVIDSYLSMCQSQDTDAQAVWSAYGPGPYKIENNYLEGSGENIMFGGADSPSADMMPQDIEIRRNLITKPDAWRTSGEWLIKNLFELKVGLRVLVEGNVFENSWTAGHTGFAMGFVSMNQSGGAPWSQVADVTFRKNYVRHSGSGINIAAAGTANATPATRFVLSDNVFEDIGRRDLLSDGRMLQLPGPVSDVLVSHNTFLHTPDGFANSAIYFAYAPNLRSTITNNIFTAGQYGIVGDAIGQGTTALAYYMPDGVFLANVFAGPVDWSRPAGSFYVSGVSALGFDSQFRLGTSSGLRGTGTDGKDPGADINQLMAAIAGVAP